MRKRARGSQTAGHFKWWTTQRATGVGLLAALAALILAIVIQSWPEGLIYPYVVMLVVAAACGASILWITAIDMRVRGTSGRMRPIRGFDLALGFGLLLPSLYALSVVSPELGN